MNTLLDKNTRANLRARDLEGALAFLHEASGHCEKAISWTQKGRFEDAHAQAEFGEACCGVAMNHLRELLP